MSVVLLFSEGAPYSFKLIVIEALIFELILMKEIDGEFFIVMRKGAKLQIFAIFLFEYPAAILTLISLGMV